MARTDFSKRKFAAMDLEKRDEPLRLLGPTVDPQYYDDEQVLTEYVWKHFQHLMTPFELRVGLYSVPVVSTSDDEKVRRIHEYCESKHGHVDDRDVLGAFPRNIDSFRLRVRQRLMLECGDKVFVNRCQNCTRIVRSPLARQCLWCNHQWHDNRSIGGT